MSFLLLFLVLFVCCSGPFKGKEGVGGEGGGV